MGEIDLAISDYSVALELDLKSGNEDENFKEEKEDQEEGSPVSEENNTSKNN